MNILVLNCGSSTLKFQLIEILETDRSERKVARGIVDRIGGTASYRFAANGDQHEQGSASMADHERATRLAIDWLHRQPKLNRIDGVGHRVVHGGDRFHESVIIDSEVISAIDQLCELAPLHNPVALSGIRAAREILGESVPMVAAFDTSFHHTIPQQAATYAISYELSQKHQIRRYGFHGLAHQYNTLRYAELAKKAAEQVNAVSLHLGNGCSATAIRGGCSIDTSMGFTPLEGLVMGTRSGDLDPALVNYLARQEKIDTIEIENWLNHRSGLLGLSGFSSDMRELTTAYEQNPRARLAVDVFCYRAQKYLGAYLNILGGAAQAVLFSGGIGENSPMVRAKICAAMAWCGVELDAAENNAAVGREGRISRPNTALQVFAISSDEETLIARDTAKLLQRQSNT